MSPFIKNADIITVSPLSSTRLSCGDVAAFASPKTGRLVVHRVIGKREKFVLLKGDNASNPDEPVPKKSILGRVIKVERNGKAISVGLGPERYLISFLSRKQFLFALSFSLWKLVRPLIER